MGGGRNKQRSRQAFCHDLGESSRPGEKKGPGCRKISKEDSGRTECLMLPAPRPCQSLLASCNFYSSRAGGISIRTCAVTDLCSSERMKVLGDPRCVVRDARERDNGKTSELEPKFITTLDLEHTIWRKTRGLLALT